MRGTVTPTSELKLRTSGKRENTAEVTILLNTAITSHKDKRSVAGEGKSLTKPDGGE